MNQAAPKDAIGSGFRRALARSNAPTTLKIQTTAIAPAHPVRKLILYHSALLGLFILAWANVCADGAGQMMTVVFYLSAVSVTVTAGAGVGTLPRYPR